MSDYQQLSLFGGEPDLPKHEDVDEDGGGSGAIRADSTLEEAREVYLVALRLSGASPYTVKAFKSDLNLLGNWAGFDTPVGEFSTDTLNRFLNWMLTERDKPCSPKTYARRVTTLKNFFGFLYEERAIPKDPSKAVIQQPVSTPLPDVLLDEEVDALLATTRAIRTNPVEPDARPHLLAMLLLQTGVKKGECVALKQVDVLRSDPDRPQLWVRYQNPRMRYKERKIDLTAELMEVLDEYLAQRKPKDGLIFDCTSRNLEYVLNDTAEAAGIDRGKMSFETMRWTCAYRDYRRGMDAERLRQKLGLSRVSWRDTSTRLAEIVTETGEGPLADTAKARERAGKG
jgi:site-specific recombinase XerD